MKKIAIPTIFLLAATCLQAQEIKLSGTSLGSVGFAVEHRSINYSIHRVFPGAYNLPFTALEVSPRWYFGPNVGAGPIIQGQFSRIEGEGMQSVAIGGMLTLRTSNFKTSPMAEFSFGLQSSGKHYDDALPLLIRADLAIGIGKRKVVSCR